MATGISELTHPVTSAIVGSARALTEVSDRGLWTLSSAETAANLEALSRLRAMVEELELRHVAHADRIGLYSEVGAADTAAWWAGATRQPRRTARRRLALATGLDAEHEPVRDAMAAGAVSEEQAGVIVAAVDALPSHRPEARRELVRLAAVHDAPDLRRLGARILEVVAPEIAEDHERRALERQEQLALESCRFNLADDGHGRCHGRFTLPTAVGAMLRKAIRAHAAPRHRHATRAADSIGLTPHVWGEAFCEYVQRYPVDRLPHAGGVDATVVVTMSLATLLGGSGPATLDTGERISPGQARRLACEAGIIPMVLGGRSEPLDLGRSRRFHSTAQRIAIAHRDRTCTAEGCDRPPSMCHVHHETPWSRGGSTTVSDGRLLCPRHHTYAHSPAYQMTRSKHGRVVFRRT